MWDFREAQAGQFFNPKNFYNFYATSMVVDILEFGPKTQMEGVAHCQVKARKAQSKFQLLFSQHIMY